MKPFLRLIQLLAAAFTAGCKGPAKHSLSDFRDEIHTPAHASAIDLLYIG